MKIIHNSPSVIFFFFLQGRKERREGEEQQERRGGKEGETGSRKECVTAPESLG